ARAGSPRPCARGSRSLASRRETWRSRWRRRGGEASAIVGPCRAVPVALRVHPDEQVKHLADGPMPADRVPQRQVLLDAVPVATAILVPDDVAGGDDAERAPLGDTDHGGDIAQPCARAVRDTVQDPRVVREDAPTAHADTLLPILETCCRCFGSGIG